MKNLLKYSLVALSLTVAANAAEKIVVGATPVPHAEILEVAKPILAKDGFTLEIKEFNDYSTPNLATEDGDLDANYFQHLPYLEEFNKNKGTHLVKTAGVHLEPMGVYSKKIKDIKELKDGAVVSIPNDPTNESRALDIIASTGLIKLNNNPLKTPLDIVDNPKKLKFTELEAGQLARSLSSTTLAAVPGNFALAAKFDLTKALILEKMNENNRKNVVVTTANKDKQFAKDLVEIVQSKEFDEIINKDFKGFDKPGK